MTGSRTPVRLPAVLVVSLVLWLPALASLLDGGLAPATAASRYAGSLVFATVAVAVVGAALRSGTDPGALSVASDDDVPRRRVDDRVVDQADDAVGEAAPASPLG